MIASFTQACRPEVCLCTDTCPLHLSNIFNYLAQKNKATSYHLGQLKAKLAKLRRELISPSGGGGGGGGIGFDVARTGVASVGFVGFPSVGKVTVAILLGFIFMLTHSQVYSHVETHGNSFRGLRD